MTKIAIYARVSTLLLQDYDRQISDLKSDIKRHKLNDGDNSFDINSDIEIYAEKISGFKKNTERPELTKLLNKIEEDPTSISSIYISEISRLGRDPSDTRKVIDRLTDKGIPVFIQSINQFTIDRNGNRNSTMNIIIQVLMEFAASEASTTKNRMISGKVEKVSKGRIHGSNLAYGYMGNDDKMLVVNPEESIVVEKIFNYYLEGIGTQVIANNLNQLNIPTRLNKTHNDKTISYKNTGEKSGSMVKWDGNTILQILKNTIYKGKRKFKGNTYDVENIAIVSEEIFDECTRIRTKKSHRNYLTRYEYLLRNNLFCGCCGRKYVGKYVPSIGGDKVYKCTSYLPNSPNGKCGELSINIGLIESVIYNEIINSELLLKYLDSPNKIKKNMERELIKYQQLLSNEESNLKTKQSELSRLLDLYLTNPNSVSELYIKKETELKKNIDTINEKISLIKSKIVSNKFSLANFNVKGASKEMIINAKNNRPELLKIFNQFIEKIIINTINKQYTLITLFIKTNGITLNRTLKLLIFAGGVRSVRFHSKKIYRYLPVLHMENEPIFKNNILIADKTELLTEVNYLVQLANQDTGNVELHQKFIEVPKENWLFINPQDNSKN